MSSDRISRGSGAHHEQPETRRPRAEVETVAPADSSNVTLVPQDTGVREAIVVHTNGVDLDRVRRP